MYHMFYPNKVVFEQSHTSINQKRNLSKYSEKCFSLQLTYRIIRKPENVIIECKNF